jgi:hypothetical protein
MKDYSNTLFNQYYFKISINLNFKNRLILKNRVNNVTILRIMKDSIKLHILI